MSTNNTENTVPTLSVPMTFTDGKLDPKKFSKAAYDMAVEYTEREEQVNSQVREIGEKVWNETNPKPKHLVVSQLARAILSLQGNFTSTDQDVKDMTERVKAVYGNDDRFIRIKAGALSGLYHRERLDEKELAKVSASIK